HALPRSGPCASGMATARTDHYETNMKPEIEQLIAGIREIESSWQKIAENRRRALLATAEAYALGLLTGSVRDDLEARAEQCRHQWITAVCAARRAQAKRYGIEVNAS